MQTVDRIVEVLEEAGIDHVFSIPGGDTGRIFKAFITSRIRSKLSWRATSKRRRV
jgi:thiamine pyrophosphate-dependent acetolactate synthase large subunit-like protein